MFVNQSDGADLKARAAQDSGLQVAMDFSGVTAFAARTDVSFFSSRGPSLGSALKPDLAAVGEEIVTGAQNSFISGESYSASGFIDTAGTSFSTPLVAGAAAVLKGARPGLTVPQYRSLLINGAAPATASQGVAATVSQAGAGILNLAAAVSGTVAAYPTSLSFGAGATLHSTVQLSLSNVGAASDTYTIQAVPAGNGPAPSISASSLSLDPGAAQQVPVTWMLGVLRRANTRAICWSRAPPVGVSRASRTGLRSPVRNRQGSRFSIRTTLTTLGPRHRRR